MWTTHVLLQKSSYSHNDQNKKNLHYTQYAASNYSSDVFQYLDVWHECRIGCKKVWSYSTPSATTSGSPTRQLFSFWIRKISLKRRSESRRSPSASKNIQATTVFLNKLIYNNNNNNNTKFIYITFCATALPRVYGVNSYEKDSNIIVIFFSCFHNLHSHCR